MLTDEQKIARLPVGINNLKYQNEEQLNDILPKISAMYGISIVALWAAMNAAKDNMLKAEQERDEEINDLELEDLDEDEREELLDDFDDDVFDDDDNDWSSHDSFDAHDTFDSHDSFGANDSWGVIINNKCQKEFSSGICYLFMKLVDSCYCLCSVSIVTSGLTPTRSAGPTQPTPVLT